MEDSDRTVIPGWIGDILDIEYGRSVSEEERRAAGEQLWQDGRRFPDFDTFYQHRVDSSETTQTSPDCRAHSIRRREPDEAWNCLGKATYAAAVGEVAFGKTFTVTIESRYRDPSGQGILDAAAAIPRDIDGHVYLRDASGSQYGEDWNLPIASGPDEQYETEPDHGTEVLPLHYCLAEATIEQRRGNEEAAMELLQQGEEMDVASPHFNRAVASMRSPYG